MLAGFTHEPAVELSESLVARTGPDRCHFASDCSSAFEIALETSFHHGRNSGRLHKTGIVCLEDSYHSETN